MPKYHGKNTRVYINGTDMSNYFNSADASDTVDTAESSAFGDTDKTYVTGLKSGQIKLTGFYDDTAGATGIETILAALEGGTASPILTVVAPDSLNSRGHAAKADETSLARSSPIGGVITMSADFQATGGAAGLDEVQVLLAKGTLGVSTSPGGTSDAFNGGTATAQGATGYLQVFSVSGGTPVVTVEHSANGSTGWTTLLSFSGVTGAQAPQAQQVQVTGTVQPYKRVAIASGTAVIQVTLNQPPV